MRKRTIPQAAVAVAALLLLAGAVPEAAKEEAVGETPEKTKVTYTEATAELVYSIDGIVTEKVIVKKEKSAEEVEASKKKETETEEAVPAVPPPGVELKDAGTAEVSQ